MGVRLEIKGCRRLSLARGKEKGEEDCAGHVGMMRGGPVTGEMVGEGGGGGGESGGDG